MDKVAVDTIAQLAIAAQGTMPIRVDNQASIAIVPSNFNLHSTEKYNLQRDRFRGAYRTVDINSFSDYAQDRKVSEFKTFISVQRGLQARSIFNIGDEDKPGHADDIAILTLEKCPEFKALENADSARFKQQDFIDWLDDWTDFITPHNTNGPVELENAIRAIRKVKISKGHETDSHVQEYGYRASVTEQMEATGVDENLPTHLVLLTESYKGLPVEQLKISIRISTKDDAPTFVLRFVGKDAHDQRRAEQFIQILEDKLLGLGTFYQGDFEA